MSALLEQFKTNEPNLKTLSDLRWCHAANTRGLADRFLADPSIHIIDCDVRAEDNRTIITAHPPYRESDQTVEDLIKKAIDAEKAMKFDVKDPEILFGLLDLLSSYRSQFVVPPILNADILQGNNAPRSKFVPDLFIEECIKAIPDATLSLSWTTTANDPYTDENIEEMRKLLNLPILSDFKGAFMIPIRASLLERSMPALQSFVGPKYPIALWNNEPLTEEQIRFVLEKIDRDTAYFDFVQAKDNDWSNPNNWESYRIDQ